jgi:hypothetical protein
VKEALIFGQLMIKLYSSTKYSKIRLYILCNLIFFVLAFAGCRNTSTKNIRILWENKLASGVIIPKYLVPDLPKDSLFNLLSIRLLSKDSKTRILGNITISDGDILFKPLIPFSKGSGYEIYYRSKKIGSFKIPLADAADAPVVNVIYPTTDTLPENLLKIYIRFSHQMQEGESGKYILLVNNKRDTLSDIFLDLQPELWSDDRKVLTMWLDPGRIKRDLQPNKRLGNPLKAGDSYKLVINKQWKSTEGLQLKQEYIKKFLTGPRDSVSPDPNQWKLTIPVAGTIQALSIDLLESLDYFLLQEAIHISDSDKNLVKGSSKIGNKGMTWSFIPAGNWKPGIYTVEIQSRLEDLAGNNINRPFDRDLKNKKTPGTKSLYLRNFKIN